MLTEKQKELLFYALAAVSDIFYYDDNLDQIHFDKNNLNLDIVAINNITKDIVKLQTLIDKTLSDLC